MKKTDLKIVRFHFVFINTKHCVISYAIIPPLKSVGVPAHFLLTCFRKN